MKKIIQVSAIALVATFTFQTVNINEAAATSYYPKSKLTPQVMTVTPTKKFWKKPRYVQFRKNQCKTTTMKRGYKRFKKISCMRPLGKKLNVTPVYNPGKGHGKGRQLVKFNWNQCRIVKKGIKRIACSKIYFPRSR